MTPSSASAESTSPLLVAVLWMVGTLLSFTLMAIAVRELAGAIHAFEIQFFRSVGALIILAPFALARPPAQTLAEVRTAAEALGWEVIAVHPADGRLEATHTTAIFRFVDDVVVRVRPASGSGSLVDVRSAWL